MKRLLWLFIALLLPASTFSQAQQLQTDRRKPTFTTPRASEYAADSVLVRYRPEASAVREATAHASRGITVGLQFASVPGLRLLKLPSTMNVAQALQLYRSDPDVLYAEPDFKIWATDKKPNDPMFGMQWGYLNLGTGGGVAGADIKATKAWDLSTGDKSVVIGIIDSGVQASHPDLAPNLMTPVTMLTDGDTAEDRNGHGTHTAGTVGAVGNNGIGVTGVNWNVSILACKFLGQNGSGPVSAAIACLDYMATQKDQGLNLIATSNSWGGIGYSQALYDAINAHLDRGILFFAAAGNGDSFGNGIDNDQFPHYPASYDLDNIVSVAATDRTDSLGQFSNFGLHSTHIGAPGVDILSTVPDWLGSYASASGTSMATPHVSGAAALLKAWNPNLKWWQLRNLLLAGGDKIPALAKTVTGNRLNVYGSMTCSGRIISVRTSPRRNLVMAVVGEPVKLKMLNIACDQPAGSINITGPSGETIVLHDDGLDGDDAAGDGIYTARWTPTATGTYQFTFPGSDVVTVDVVKVYDFTTGTQGNYVNFAGTNLNLGDEKLAVVSIPFLVRFGGQRFSQIYVSDNGYASFDSKASVGLGFPMSAPNFGSVIAPFWFDFNPAAGTSNNVFWGVSGTAPNRQLVIEWRDLPAYPLTPVDGTVRFEIVLNESSDDISFNYADVFFGGPASPADSGSYASVGVQSTPDWATQYSWYQPVLTNGLSLNWKTQDPDFQLSETPAQQTVFLGQLATFNHVVTAKYGFAGDVVLSCSGPTAVTCTAGTVTATQEGAAVPVTAQSTVVGNYALSVQAQGPASFPVIKSTTMTLNVVDFNLGAPSQTTLTVPDGGSGSVTIPVGFSGQITTPVTLSCTGLPAGASCAFSPSNTIQPSTTPTQVTMTVQLAPQTPSGNVALQIVATEPNAPYQRTQAVTITVQPNPDFFLTTSTPVITGSTATGTITVKNQDSYTGTVSLSCSVVPTGPACSVSPVTISAFPGDTTVTISLGATPAGNFTVTVTGNDGKNSHNVTLAYAPFDFFPTVASGVIVYGTITNAMPFTLTGINGYGGTVNVACDASALGPNSNCWPSVSQINFEGRTTFQSTLSIWPGNRPSWTGSYPVVATFTDTASRISHTVISSVTPQTFTFEPDQTMSQIIYPGQATDPIPYTLTPINGFNQQTSVQAFCNSCSYSLSPASVIPNGSPVPVNLTVTSPVLRNPSLANSTLQVTAWGTVSFPWSTMSVPSQTLTTVLVKDFGLSSSTLPGGYYAPFLNVEPGKSNSFQLKYQSFNGYDFPVQIACPAEIGFGLHCSVDKTQLLPNDSATFTFSADANVTASTRSLEIQGTSTLPDSRQIAHSFDIILNISDFSVSLAPATITVPAGGTASYQMTVVSSAQSGIYDPATVTCTTTDPGVTCTAPASIAFPGSASIQVSTTDGATPVGPHTFTVTVSDFNSSASATGTIVMQGYDSLIVTAPNGGELWPSGSQNITWNYSGNPGSTVKIELLKNGVLDRLIADNVPIGTNGTGSYSWALPDTLPFSQHYQIRISSDSRTDITDNSDNRVWMGKGLDFNSPDASTVVYQGDIIIIQYTWAGNANIDFDLYKGGKLLKQLVHGSSSGYSNEFCHCWTTVGATGTDTPPGNDYTIVGTPTGDPSRAATSKPFTIGMGAITITYPKGGEIWHPGESRTVTWTWSTNYLNPSHEMSLVLTDVYSQRTITLSTDIGLSGSGSYTFAVPADTPPSTSYRVAARTYGTPSIGGTSAAPFAVGDYHSLAVQITGSGYVTSTDYQVSCSNSCSYFYNAGKSVTLQANSPNFAGWSGGCSGTGTCTVTLNTDVVVSATFTAQDVAFTPVGSPPGPIKAGTSAQFGVSLASTPGFTSQAVLSCSALPLASDCTFDKNNLSLSPTPTVVTVTLHTTGSNGVRSQNWNKLLQRVSMFALLGVLGLMSRSKRSHVLFTSLVLLLVLQFVACGGGGSTSSGGGGGGGTMGTPPGNYQITITVTAGTITHAITVPITVQ